METVPAESDVGPPLKHMFREMNRLYSALEERQHASLAGAGESRVPASELAY